MTDGNYLMLGLIEDIMSTLDNKMSNYPYHINVLDLTHFRPAKKGKDENKANENAHTRILDKILHFKSDKGFVVLNSLLNYIINLNHKEWEVIKEKISNPIFKLEASCMQDNKGRIDLLISEIDKYAIIIENKINLADDQHNQLARYIEEVKNNRNYKIDNIFIIYLSKNGIEPEPYSWVSPINNNNYREMFINRYINFSYENHVLPWLKTIAVDSKKEQYLYSTLVQYIDFLEGEFGIRENDKLKASHLEDIIRDIVSKRDSLQYNIDDIKKRCDYLFNNPDLNDRIKAIDETIKCVKEVNEGFNNYRSRISDESIVAYCSKIIEKGDDLLNELLSLKQEILRREVFCNKNYGFEIHLDGIRPDRTNYFAVKLKIDNFDYYVYIGQGNRFFCSIITDNPQLMPDNHSGEFENILPSHGNNNDWRAKYLEKDDFVSAVLKMREVLDKCVELQSRNEKAK